MSVNIKVEGSLENKLSSMVRVIEEHKKASKDSLAIISNAMAIMNLYIDDINWVGTYILREGRLYLGPFQGNPACMEIELENGVCGHAATTRKSIIVDNVHDFPGHIACDSRSLSEIVVPVLNDKEEVIALIDIDSPKVGTFNEVHKEYVEKVALVLKDLLINI